MVATRCDHAVLSLTQGEISVSRAMHLALFKTHRNCRPLECTAYTSPHSGSPSAEVVSAAADGPAGRHVFHHSLLFPLLIAAALRRRRASFQ